MSDHTQPQPDQPPAAYQFISPDNPPETQFELRLRVEHQLGNLAEDMHADLEDPDSDPRVTARMAIVRVDKLRQMLATFDVQEEITNTVVDAELDADIRRNRPPELLTWFGAGHLVVAALLAAFSGPLAVLVGFLLIGLALAAIGVVDFVDRRTPTGPDRHVELVQRLEQEISDLRILAASHLQASEPGSEARAEAFDQCAGWIGDAIRGATPWRR